MALLVHRRFGRKIVGYYAPICVYVLVHKRHKHHLQDLVGGVVLKILSHRITGCFTCHRARIPVYASANCAEGDAGAAILLGELEAAQIAALQERSTHHLVVEDGADCVDDVLGGEVVPAGDDGLAGLAAVRIPVHALPHELRASGGVDGAVDAAAAAEGGVCGVDDGVDGEGGDVCADETDTGVDLFVGWDLPRGVVWEWELGWREAVGRVEGIDIGDVVGGLQGRPGRRIKGGHGETVVWRRRPEM